MKSCLKKIIKIGKQTPRCAKKSFTLVELSIVLLILSLLVGSLLTGRQLVERAEIQKIISEIDYYQKNIVQFQDTFQFLPGNMDQDSCLKNTILYKTFYETAKTHSDSSLRTLKDDYQDVDTYCADTKRTVQGFVGLNYSASFYSYTSIYQSFAQLAQSGLIKSNTIVQKTSDTTGITWTSGPLATPPSHSVKYDERYLQPTSFNEDGLLMFASFDITANDSAGCRITDGVASGCGNSRTLNFVRGSAAYGGNTELNNTTFAENLDRKRALVLFYNDTSTTYTSVSANVSGIVSASMMNKIDQKMDDGRPGTGNILALKSGMGRGTYVGNQTSVCYNGNAEKVSDAYYLNSDDAIYGCNIVAIF